METLLYVFNPWISLSYPTLHLKKENKIREKEGNEKGTRIGAPITTNHYPKIRAKKKK